MTSSFLEEAKQLLKMMPVSNKQFWTHLEDKPNSYYWTLKLYDIVSIPSKRERYTPSAIQSMLSTMLVLEYFNSSLAKDPSMVQDSKIRLSSQGKIVSSHFKWLIMLFLENCPEEQFVKGFIKKLAGLPDTLLPTEHPAEAFERELVGNQLAPRDFKPLYQMIRGVWQPNDNSNSQDNTAELTFIYLCFCDYIIAKNLSIKQTIYEDICICLRTLMNASQSPSRELTVPSWSKQNCVLCMMLLLQNLLRFQVFPYSKVAKELMIVVDVFKRMPFPICQLADEIVKMLYAELKSLGSNYRLNVRAQIASIDSVDIKDLVHDAFLIRKDSHIFAKSGFCTTDTIRKSLIYNIIASVYKNDPQLYEKISGLPEHIGFTYYSKLLRMLQISEELENFDDIHSIQLRSVEQIATAIMQQHSDPNHDSKEDLQNMYQNPDLKVFEFPPFEIVCVELGVFTDLSVKNRNFKDIMISRRRELPYHQEKLRVVFQGSDADFRRLVQVLAECYPSLHKDYVGLEIFLLPPKNALFGLAIYLGNRDIWYSRFIYNVFRDRALFPDFIPEIDTKKLLPHFLQESTIQMYLREASKFVDIRVFKATVRFTAADKQPQLIYFCQYVCVGSSVYTEIHRKLKEKYLFMDSMELYMEKVKSTDKHSHDFTASLEVDACNCFGEFTERLSEKSVQIHDLKIVNLPMPYFMGNSKEPYQNYLEMSFLPESNYANFAKELYTNSNFKKTEQNPTFAFRGNFCSSSVSSLKIEFLQKPARVLIDGQMFDQVQAINIQTKFAPKDVKEFALPIKTFLPFQF